MLVQVELTTGDSPIQLNYAAGRLVAVNLCIYWLELITRKTVGFSLRVTGAGVAG